MTDDVLARAEQWHQQNCIHRDRDGLVCTTCADAIIDSMVQECRRLQELNKDLQSRPKKHEADSV